MLDILIVKVSFDHSLYVIYLLKTPSLLYKNECENQKRLIRKNRIDIVNLKLKTLQTLSQDPLLTFRKLIHELTRSSPGRERGPRA